MRTVEYFNLALFVWLYAVGKYYIEPRGVGGKHLLHEGLLFEHPEVEYFALHHVVVYIARLFLYGGDFRLGIAGNYAVYERGSEVVCRLHPLYELFVHLVDFCKLGEHAVELVAVVVDKFAGNYRKALVFRAAEFIVPALQQGEQFAGERFGAYREIGIRFVERYARLGGVGNYYLQIFALAVAEEFFVVGEGVYAVADDVDYLALFNPFALVDTFQTEGIQTVLGGNIFYPAEGHRLNYYHVGIYRALIVQILQYPFDERTQKVAFAELHYFDFSFRFIVNFFAKLFHRLKIPRTIY